MAKFDESKHPRAEDGRFTKSGEVEYRQNTSYDEIIGGPNESLSLSDEILPRSVGARWANYDILAPDGTTAHFQEGSKLHHKAVIAGKGLKRKIDDIERVSKLFPNAIPGDIQKLKAIGTIVTESGEIMDAEIHWYQAGSERDEHKIKRYL